MIHTIIHTTKPRVKHNNHSLLSKSKPVAQQRENSSLIVILHPPQFKGSPRGTQLRIRGTLSFEYFRLTERKQYSNCDTIRSAFLKVRLRQNSSVIVALHPLQFKDSLRGTPLCIIVPLSVAFIKLT